MADLANVFVDIKGRWAQFEAEAQGRLGATGSKIGKSMGVAILGGAGLAIAGTAGLAKIGETFDDMSDTIRVGTGATGKALDALEQSAINVGKSIPTSFGDAGTAVADLNTRLGLTGKPLETVSAQMLELSRITGTDLTSNITSSSRVMGDWGITADKIPGTLDGMFRASQATGISFDKLGQQLVTYGAPLRQMGFGFEESAAILGKFEKEGVNAELVMGSMRQALGKMAREGIPAQEGLEQTVEAIKNAGSTSEANALALELFGARAGPDMAAAIREGRFEVDELMGIIGDGDETIVGAAEATNDWREKLQILGNRAMARLAPLAEKVFTGITTGLEIATPYIERFADWLGDRIPEAMAALRRVWDRNGATVMAALATGVAVGSRVLERLRDGLVAAFGWIIDNRPVLIGILTAVAVGFGAWAIAAGAAAISTIAAVAPFIAVGVAIAAVVAAVIWAYTEWGFFRAVVDAVASFMADTLWPIVQRVVQVVGTVLVKAVEIAIDVFGKLVGAARAVWRWMQQVWDRTAGFRSFLVGAFAAGVGVARGVIETYVGAYRTAWRWAKSLWDRTEGLRGFLVGAFKTGVDIAKRAIALMWAAMQTAWRWAKSLWDRTEGLRSFLAGAFKRGVDIAKGVVDGLKGAFDRVRDAVQFVIDKVQWLIDKIPDIPSIPGAGLVGDAVGAIIPGRAAGGPVDRNRPYWVGEQGPELFMPGADGFITPHDRSMAAARGGPMVVINHHGQTVTPDTISRGLRMARMR